MFNQCFPVFHLFVYNKKLYIIHIYPHSDYFINTLLNTSNSQYALKEHIHKTIALFLITLVQINTVLA